jgi:phage terminase large subunit-like protein
VELQEVADSIAQEIRSHYTLSRSARVFSLAEFIRRTWHIVEPGRPLIWNWHIDAICEHLEACLFGYIDPATGKRAKLQDLAIIVPPGTSKSRILAVFFPAYAWLHNATLRFLFITNSHSNGTRDSMACRRIIESPEYQALVAGDWGLTQGEWGLTSDQNAKDWYETTRGGHRQTIGIKSETTGKKGDFVIVDDANDAKGVQSKAERDSVNGKFRDSIWDRVNDWATGVRIVCAQRTHVDDLIGFIIANYVGWCVLYLPEELQLHKRCRTCIGFVDPRTKHGELLRPHQFTRTMAENYKSKQYRNYRTKHLGDPQNDAGNRFKSANFRYWHVDGDEYVFSCPIRGEYRCKWKDFLEVFGVADGAASAKRSADFTVVTGFAITPRFDLVILGMRRFQAEIPEQPKLLAAAMKSMKLDWCYVEAVAGNVALFQLANRMSLAIRKANPKQKDKLARATIALILSEAYRLWLPDEFQSPGTDVVAIIEELKAFTGIEKEDAHDDIVDTVSYAAEHLVKQHPDEEPSSEPPIATTETTDYFPEGRNPFQGANLPKAQPSAINFPEFNPQYKAK